MVNSKLPLNFMNVIIKRNFQCILQNIPSNLRPVLDCKPEDEVDLDFDLDLEVEPEADRLDHADEEECEDLEEDPVDEDRLEEDCVDDDCSEEDFVDESDDFPVKSRLQKV